MRGECGIATLSRFDASGLKWRSAGQVPAGLDLEARFGGKQCRRYDPFVLYALIAAEDAMSDASMPGETLAASRAGVVMGSGRGGISSMESAVNGRASAFLMAGTTISMAASHLAARFGVRGHVLGVSNACASGANALGEGMRLIRDGHLDVVMAGGAEAPLTPLCLRGYGISGALSRTGVMRPFDVRRDGFVLSEGASVLVLEEMEHARSRGARIYAELAGYGNSADAHHPTVPLSSGQTAAISQALSEAGLTPGDIGLVSAHATSTQKGDRAEFEAMSMTELPPAWALKSMTGHMLAASGAFEAAAAAMALSEGVVPPTINSEPEFDINLSPLPRKVDAQAAICHSFGFGGVNAVLALRRI